MFDFGPTHKAACFVTGGAVPVAQPGGADARGALT
jgi:hypothetical protein